MSEEKNTGFEESLVQVNRVTRVTKGGRQLSFRAIMLVGDKKGKVGLGMGKSPDVVGAINKAIHEAYKNIVEVPIVGNDTIPYQVTHKYKAASIKLLPASAGTGVKAGSTVRLVLEMAGYHNVLSKIVGTNNKLNNAIATISALTKFKVDQEQLVKRVFEEETENSGGEEVSAKGEEVKEQTVTAEKDTGDTEEKGSEKKGKTSSASKTSETSKSTSTAKSSASKTTGSKTTKTGGTKSSSKTSAGTQKSGSKTENTSTKSSSGSQGAKISKALTKKTSKTSKSTSTAKSSASKATGSKTAKTGGTKKSSTTKKTSTSKGKQETEE